MFLPLNDKQFESWKLRRSAAKLGMQVWYKHVGNCGACTRYARCIELLWDFADEMKIKLERTDDPTKLADELFDKMRLA